jgi:hypothetical protein
MPMTGFDWHSILLGSLGTHCALGMATSPSVPVTEKGTIMRAPIAFVLIASGAILLYFGLTASESFSSSVTRLFNGLPTERSQWLMIGGIVAIALGIGVFLRRSAT